MTTELVRLDIQQQMITDESINDYESTARFYTMRGKKGQRGLDAQIKQSASVKITERSSSSTFAECGESGLEGKKRIMWKTSTEYGFALRTARSRSQEMKCGRTLHD